MNMGRDSRRFAFFASQGSRSSCSPHYSNKKMMGGFPREAGKIGENKNTGQHSFIRPSK